VPRVLVAGLIVGAVVAMASSAFAAVAPPRPILGTAVNDKALNSDAVYTAGIRKNYRSVTAETAASWKVIQPQRDVFNFAPMDKVMNFAAANRLRVEALPLLWYKGNPSWVNNGNFTRAEFIEILQNHIRTVIGRYRGKIAVWHVANESVDPTGAIHQNVWYRKIGPDYLDIAFRTAHEADPAARLYYNDAGGEVAGGGKLFGATALIAGLRSRGVPVHGVGLQMHTTILSGKEGGPVKIGALFHKPNARKFLDVMNHYGRLGLDVSISEMDVRLKLPSTAKMLRKQKAVYNVVYKACIKAPNCKALTTWGYTDKYSWVNAWTGGVMGDALPFDKRLARKPAARVFFK
jgi:endo-1,4-beta-xylanase